MTKFTWDYIRKQFEVSLETGHKIITVKDYFGRKKLPEKFHINRVDVDFSVEKAERIVLMFNDLCIKGTFYVRLHEYNLLSYKNYRILKFIQNSGHEIGLHTETVDFSVVCEEDEYNIFLMDLDRLSAIIDDDIYSYASHNDNRTPHNNGVIIDNVFYNADKISDDIITVTDSDWTKWKSYLYGKKWTPMDIATAATRYDKIYTLIHPCTYYEKHVFDD